MKKQNPTRLAAASILLFAAASLHAAPVIYEPFAYDAGGLNGKGGTSDFGFAANWSASAESFVVATNLQYGALATTGGSIGGLGASINRFGGARPCAAALATPANLLADGTTLWFSVIVGYETGANNTRLGFALANSSFSTGNNQYYINNEGAQLGAGVGFSLSGNTNGVVNATHFRDSSFGTGIVGIVNGNTSGTIVSNGNPPRLLVGSIAWGATEDVITIYAPNASLELGSAISTLTVNVDQSTFDTITWARGDKIMMDEIRFGATSADVMPLDTVAPSLVSIADDQAGGPVSEDLAAITYALTFDRPMDLTTITAADFDTLGTATSTIGTITQPSPNLILVQVLPTTTGTVQLRIPAGSVLSSFVPLDLDTTAAILSDTITINPGSTPDTGIRYWDGAITSGITDGVSQGGTGTWNTTNTNWDKGAGFAGPVAWNNANLDTAILGGANGTISLGTGITAGGITSSSTYTIQNNTLTLDVASGTPVVNVTANTLTISSKISGSDGLIKNSGGTLLLTGANDFSGGLTLGAGTLQVNNGSGVFGTGTLTVNGGQIRANTNGQVSTTTNNHVWNGNFQLSRGATGTATWNFEGDITLGNNVTVTHADNTVITNLSGNIGDGGNNRLLTLAGSNGFITLSGTNTHGGGTRLNAGTLRINHSSALGSGTFAIHGGIIDNTSGNPITLSTNNVQAWNANLTFTGTNDLNLGTGAVTMDNNRTVTVTAGTLTVGGAIGQSGGNRTLNKEGGGTLVLSGANTYAGNTTVTAGTLALVGGSQNSAITVNNLAKLGFTLGSPTTSSKAVTLNAGHSIVITGTVNNASDYKLMTATGFTGTPTLASPGIDDYELELREGETELWLKYTGTGGSPYDTWAATFSPADLSDPQADFDSDGLKNIQEFAFGTNPTTATGAITIDGSGNVTNGKGKPIAYMAGITEDSVDFRAVFSRRKDHVAAGLVYTVQFSTELDEWVNYTFAVDEPILLDGSDTEIDVVYVPFPLVVETTNGFEKPHFVRVGVAFAE